MLEKIKNHKFIYEIYLIIASVFWAMAFIWMKQAMDDGLSPQQVLLVRYSVAVLLMLPFCIKELKQVRKQDVFLGLVGGALMFSGMLAQAIALEISTPSNSAFITTTFVVMVPFVAWAIEKKRPSGKTYVCAVLALIGLYVLTKVPGQSFAIEPATAITALSALIFSFQVVFITYAGRRMSVKLLTFLPLCFVALFTIATTAIKGELAISSPNVGMAVFNVALAALFATIIAGALQVLGQTRVDSSRASIIMSLESVFTCVISVIMGYDALNISLIIGGILIVAAIIISEYKT